MMSNNSLRIRFSGVMVQYRHRGQRGAHFLTRAKMDSMSTDDLAAMIEEELEQPELVAEVDIEYGLMELFDGEGRSRC